MEETTKKSIQLMGIYDLRTMARNVGVPSPTTLKRQQLIDSIINILDGKQEAVPVSRVGRPPKKTKLDLSGMDVYIPQDFIDYATEEKNKKYISDTIVFEQDLDLSRFGNKIREDKGGVLRHTKSGAYFFKNGETVVFVPANIVADHKLIDGDFIEGGVWKIYGKAFEIFFALEKLNGKVYEREERNIVEFNSIQASTNENEGIRNIQKYSIIPDFVNDYKQILKSYHEKGFTILRLGVGLIPELALRLKSLEIGNEFLSYFDDGPGASLDTTLDAINHSMALARNGEKVVLFVFDISTLITELDTYFRGNKKEKEDGIMYDTMLVLRKLYGISRCLTNGGSVTLVGGHTEDINL